MNYPIGSQIDITVSFSTPDGAPVDPTEVTLQMLAPRVASPTEVTYPGTVTRSSAGNYSYSVNLTEGGTWAYRWVGTGAYVGTTGDVSFTVDPSEFPPT
jgi:hypothetical protein